MKADVKHFFLKFQDFFDGVSNFPGREIIAILCLERKENYAG